MKTMSISVIALLLFIGVGISRGQGCNDEDADASVQEVRIITTPAAVVHIAFKLVYIIDLYSGSMGSFLLLAHCIDDSTF